MNIQDKLSFYLLILALTRPLCVQLLWGVLSMVALPIDDGLQPPDQRLDGVPQALT